MKSQDYFQSLFWVSQQHFILSFSSSLNNSLPLASMTPHLPGFPPPSPAMASQIPLQALLSLLLIINVPQVLGLGHFPSHSPLCLLGYIHSPAKISIHILTVSSLHLLRPSSHTPNCQFNISTHMFSGYHKINMSKTEFSWTSGKYKPYTITLHTHQGG